MVQFYFTLLNETIFILSLVNGTILILPLLNGIHDFVTSDSRIIISLANDRVRVKELSKINIICGGVDVLYLRTRERASIG